MQAAVDALEPLAALLRRARAKLEVSRRRRVKAEAVREAIAQIIRAMRTGGGCTRVYHGGTGLLCSVLLPDVPLPPGIPSSSIFFFSSRQGHVTNQDRTIKMLRRH